MKTKLTSDGLRHIIDSFKNNPEKIYIVCYTSIEGELILSNPFYHLSNARFFAKLYGKNRKCKILKYEFSKFVKVKKDAKSKQIHNRRVRK